MWAKELISVLFSMALFFNAMLFIPQAIKILKTKNVAGLSLFTFIGFCVTQLLAIIYGVLQHDNILVFGYLLSLITCGTVTIIILYYRFIRL